MFTPWGKSDYQHKIAEGVYWVGTPSHGGLMIGRKVAEEYLTPQAIEKGEPFATWLAYEEDCAWAIPCFEMFFWLVELNKLSARPKPMQECYQEAYDTVTVWYLDYLESRDIGPSSPELAQRFRDMKRDDEMRRDKHPDLMIAARGDWAEGCPMGAVEVTTADGEKHFITADSYKNLTGLHLLSRCVIFG